MSTITDVAVLREKYGEPSERALKKEMQRLDHHCRRFIEISPFLTMATAGADGRLDCSPRGDGPGFVAVLDDKTLLIPDRRGNNRVDSLSNILEHPNIGLLFMVPGMNETLRVNGRARLVDDPELLASHEIQGKVPRSGILVEVEEVYLQCAKALQRSRLWSEEAKIDRKSFPSMGKMLADQIDGVDADEFDRQASDVSTLRLY